MKSVLHDHSRTIGALRETIIVAQTDSVQSTNLETLSDNAVSHSSGDVFTLGNKLIDHIEKHLEQILRQGVGLRYTLRTVANQTTPAKELHYMFTLHSEYIRHNLTRQRALITDVDMVSRSFIISEISVIESQKQTIERLMGAYSAAVFSQQSELANLKANMLAIMGVIVAVAAFIITDMRFQTLLK